jgi:Mn2+/Fe2+ NRAMP family transporter
VGGALISACGVTGHAIADSIHPPFNDSPAGALAGKITFGAAHSLIGVIIVLTGGFKWFERFMSLCVGIMFAAVVITAIRLGPDWVSVIKGSFVPTIPEFAGEGLVWTISLIGGVGGTVTILCYGYWIREAGRSGADCINTCRVDLGVGYCMTALFGMAMLIIAARVTGQDGSGAQLIVALADQVGQTLGASGRWLFLFGAWAAVFSSLLGVWQSVPYLFTDLFDHLRERHDAEPVTREINSGRMTYRVVLIAIAVVPMVQTLMTFKEVQKAYTVVGAFFLPMLAVALLMLNGKSGGVEKTLRNRATTVIALVFIIAFFAVAGWLQIRNSFAG